VLKVFTLITYLLHGAVTYLIS